jgi:hypothetical protein
MKNLSLLALTVLTLSISGPVFAETRQQPFNVIKFGMGNCFLTSDLYHQIYADNIYFISADYQRVLLKPLTCDIDLNFFYYGIPYPSLSTGLSFFPFGAAPDGPYIRISAGPGFFYNLITVHMTMKAGAGYQVITDFHFIIDISGGVDLVFLNWTACYPYLKASFGASF